VLENTSEEVSVGLSNSSIDATKPMPYFYFIVFNKFFLSPYFDGKKKKKKITANTQFRNKVRAVAETVFASFAATSDTECHCSFMYQLELS
jgi:hypothetical protein